MPEPQSQSSKDARERLEAYYQKPISEISLEEMDNFVAPKIEDYFDTEDASWQSEIPKPQLFTPKTIEQFAVLQSNGWLIKNVIPRAELCMIYGPPGSGKTFAALDMGMAVARHAPQWGSERVKGGRVVYVCAEAPAGFRNRIMAYMQRHELAHQDLTSFQVIDDVPNLLSLNDHKSVAAKIDKADLIFIDTLSSVISGGDENAGKDMNILVSNCKALARATNATVVLIGHSGKNADNGHRGWSGMLGAVDAEIRVEAQGTAHTMTVTKQKEGESGKSYGFYLKPIELGEDEDGDPITSCAFEPSDVKIEKHEKAEKLGHVELLIIECFDEFHSYEVNADDLRKNVIARLDRGHSDRDLRPQRFKNSIERLQEKGMFYIKDQKIYKRL